MLTSAPLPFLSQSFHEKFAVPPPILRRASHFWTVAGQYNLVIVVHTLPRGPCSHLHALPFILWASSFRGISTRRLKGTSIHRHSSPYLSHES